MNVQRRVNPLALIPLTIGLLWLYASFQWLWWGVLILPAGVLFTATGVAALLWSGDRRITAFMAISVLAGLLVVPLLFCYLNAWLLLLSLPLISLSAGYIALHSFETPPGIPSPDISPRLALRMAIDEGLVAFLVSCVPLPKPHQTDELVKEQDDALKMFDAKGWLQTPESYHVDPPAPENCSITKKQIRKYRLEHLQFESAYAPHDGEPGADRWASYQNNATAHALVFRKANTPEENAKPWLICVHGYQMGTARWDFMLFNPKHYHDNLGYNMLMPTLALHGKRTEGRLSGDGFLSGNAMDTVHAAAQSISDIRQSIKWARAQGATSIGVLGYSLGGYHAALLAAIEPDIDVVIPGIAASDLPMLIWHHAPINIMNYMHYKGLDHAKIERLSTVTSPLAISRKVDKERCYLFGGTIDRITPPELQEQLRLHWGKPAMHWFQGGHLSVGSEPPLRSFIDHALMTHLK